MRRGYHRSLPWFLNLVRLCSLCSFPFFFPFDFLCVFPLQKEKRNRKTSGISSKEGTAETPYELGTNPKKKKHEKQTKYEPLGSCVRAGNQSTSTRETKKGTKKQRDAPGKHRTRCGGRMDTCRNSSTRPWTRTNRNGGKKGRGEEFQETRADQPNVGASAPKQYQRHIRTHQGRNETDKDLLKRAAGTHRSNASPGSTAPTHRADRTHA